MYQMVVTKTARVKRSPGTRIRVFESEVGILGSRMAEPWC